MAQQGEQLVPNAKAISEPKQTIKGYLTFEDTIFNDGIKVGVEVILSPTESKSSVDAEGKGRQMFRISGSLPTDDPRNGMTYKMYSGTLGAYNKATKFTKVEKED